MNYGNYYFAFNRNILYCFWRLTCINNNTTFYDKLKLDLTYIRNYSVFLDLRLIMMTPKVMFMKEATEGVKHETIEEKVAKEVPSSYEKSRRKQKQ